MDFGLITNNCWGYEIYNILGIEYKTPFVGLFLFSPDYIKLLENFEELIYKDVKIYNGPIHSDKKYPKLILNDEIIIHCMHDNNPDEVLNKWKRRVNRLPKKDNKLDFDKLYFKIDDRDLCTPEIFERFHKLSYKNKACFTVMNSGYPTADYHYEKTIPDEYSYQVENLDFSVNKKTGEPFNIMKWLNLE